MRHLDLLDQIEQLFDTHGHQPYEGRRAESVTALAHALQCAQLAEWAHARPGLVAAALLHDIGHFLTPDVQVDEIDDVHELRALGLLGREFGTEVLEPIRLHVQAKRYLVAVDPGYVAGLSPASVHSLDLQGGPLRDDELRAFEALPYADDAVALRRWDDLAKTPGERTPPLAYYLSLLDNVRLPGHHEQALLQPYQPRRDTRIAIGAIDC
jgi:phosphonate degradation associated HDIG domain protein